MSVPRNLRVTPENLVPLPALAPYFLLGLLSFSLAPVTLLGAMPALEAGFYRHPLLLAALHLYALGWGTGIALGALQQMSPVLFATVLYSPRLASWAWLPFTIGLTALIWAFFSLHLTGFILAGVLLPLGVAMVLLNLWFTQRTATLTRQATLVRPYVRGAAAYLFMTIVAGALLSLNLTTGWLGTSWQGIFPLHVAFGAVGWFLMLITGISYHLLPFFGLVDKKHRPRWDATVRRLIHTALGVGVVAAVVPVFFSGDPLSMTIPLLLLLMPALALFLWDNRQLFTPRETTRMHPMVGYVRAAHVYLLVLGAGLLVVLILTLTASSPNLQAWIIPLGVLAVGGWLSNTILGYLHRILAFVTWHNKYWGRGREPGVPAFRRMVNNRVAWVGFALYNAGVVATAAALATPLPLAPSLWLLLGGSILAAGNLVRTLLR